MVSNAMQVLRLFAPERPELGVVEAAALLHKPKSTTSRWLRAMEEAGFLERDATSGRFRLSLVLAALGEVARESTSLQRLGRPILEALTERTGETSNLVVLDGNTGVNVEVVRSPQPVQHVGVLGRRLPLHATAAGKVLMAWLPAGQRDSLLAGGLPACASRTVIRRDALEEELARVRGKRFATAWKELEEDLAAASAPVRDHQGRVVAAMTTSGPITRITPDSLDQLADHVRKGADQLSAALGYQPPH
jgi:IclR family transcriptional regulator, acetate operon repressor